MQVSAKYSRVANATSLTGGESRQRAVLSALRPPPIDMPGRKLSAKGNPELENELRRLNHEKFESML